MTTNTTIPLGRAIELVRTARHMTRRDLALISGLSYPTLCRLEAEKGAPSLNAQKSICDALRISMSDMFSVLEQIDKGVSITIPAPQ